MIKTLTRVNWKRDFFYYFPLKSNIKKPLVISLAFHLGLLLLAFNHREIDMINDFTVTIESDEPREMAVKNKDRFSMVKDQIAKKKKDIDKEENKIEDSNILSSESQSNDNLNKNTNHQERFNEEFENTLFSRKESKKNLQKKDKNIDKKKFNWQEEQNIDPDHSEKDKEEQSVSIPGGEASSRTITWKEGYARRLVYQPKIDYPLYFRKQGIQATMVIVIEVDAAGNVVSAEVKKSSGYSKLDILGRNGVLKSKFSRRESQSQNYDIAEVEVQFRLER